MDVVIGAEVDGDDGAGRQVAEEPLRADPLVETARGLAAGVDGGDGRERLTAEVDGDDGAGGRVAEVPWVNRSAVR